jgi:hypothetical protein
MGNTTQFLSPGERAMLLVLARDQRQARVLFGYIRGIVNAVRYLSRMVTAERATEIDINNSVTIAVYTSDYRSVRGTTVCGVLLDEIAHWSSEGASPDREVLAALRPAMASIPTAKLLALSSPYGKTGVLYESFRDHYGKADSDVLVWRASTRQMNPLISEKVIDRERSRDAASSRSEWDAQFREDLESYISREALELLVIPDRRDLPPTSELQYSAFVDPAGGSGQDSMAMAIGHRQRDGKLVVDAIRERRPSFSPKDCIREFADLLAAYRCTKVHGDRYAGEWPREGFRDAQVHYEVATSPKSDLYRDCLAHLTSQQVELPDSPRLIGQFAALERRTGRAGKDTIDHPNGQHDDMCNAVAGLLTVLGKPAHTMAMSRLLGF